MKIPLLTLVAALSLAGAALADHEPGHKVLVLKNKEGAAILGFRPGKTFERFVLPLASKVDSLRTLDALR
jgi:hypothetical protein